MKLLAIDTSSEACSAALWLDGQLLEQFEQRAQHSELILPMVDALMAEAGLVLAQLDCIAFGRGPGSFTGLRIGTGVAQGLAFGSDLPVAPVSSLAALAQGVDAPRVCAALDARMRQVYWGLYQRNSAGLAELTGKECVAAPGAVPVPPGTDWTGAGSGWDVYGAQLTAHFGAQFPVVAGLAPRARHVAELGVAIFQGGLAIPAETAMPVYIRDDVAAKMKPGR